MINGCEYFKIKQENVNHVCMYLLLQSCSMAYDEVTEDNVYLCVGHPLRRDIESIVTWMLNENFQKAYNRILCQTNAKYPEAHEPLFLFFRGKCYQK